MSTQPLEVFMASIRQLHQPQQYACENFSFWGWLGNIPPIPPHKVPVINQGLIISAFTRELNRLIHRAIAKEYSKSIDDLKAATLQHEWWLPSSPRLSSPYTMTPLGPQGHVQIRAELQTSCQDGWPHTQVIPMTLRSLLRWGSPAGNTPAMTTLASRPSQAPEEGGSLFRGCPV